MIWQWTDDANGSTLRGKAPRSLTVEAEKRPTGEGKGRGEQLYYKPGAPPVTLTKGRFNWSGRDPLWKP